MVINSQNVDQLVKFFNENTAVPLPQLKDSALATGYTQEDVDAALAAVQASHPQAQATTTGSTPTEAPPTSQKSSKKLILTIVAIVSIFGALGLGVIALIANRSQSATSRQTSRATAEKATPTTVLSQPTLLPTATPTEKPLSPLAKSKMALASKLYKVDANGKLTGNEASVSGTQKTTLDLTNATFYLKNGDVLRADLREQGNKQSLLISGGNFYFLETTDETYTQLNTPPKLISASPYYAILRYSLPIVGLIEAEDQQKLVWQKLSETEWLTEWAYPLLSGVKNATPYQIKVQIEASSNLISTFSLRASGQAEWQDVTLRYTALDTLDPILVIPKSYKKVALGAPTATPTASVTPTPTMKP